MHSNESGSAKPQTPPHKVSHFWQAPGLGSHRGPQTCLASQEPTQSSILVLPNSAILKYVWRILPTVPPLLKYQCQAKGVASECPPNPLPCIWMPEQFWALHQGQGGRMRVGGMEGVKDGGSCVLSSQLCALSAGPQRACILSLKHSHEISFFSFCPHPNSGSSNLGQVLGWGGSPHCPHPRNPHSRGVKSNSEGKLPDANPGFALYKPHDVG